MKMTNDQYKDFAGRHAPRSRAGRNLLRAFFSGGALCCLGQLLQAMYARLGLEESATGTAVCISLIFLGALLTGLGVYDNIAKFAGAGTLVPVTGFANSVAAPALEFKSEGFITGTAAKMFIISGPVIVYGVSASVVYGLIYWICTIL